MLYRLVLLVLLFPLPALGYWNGDWSFRTESTLTSDQARSDYRVTLDITAADLHPDYSWSSNGNDLRVIAADDSTQLSYYIVSWDDANQQATVVVNFPSLAAGTNTFYLYYGNTTATSASSATSALVPGLSYTSRQSTLNPGNWNQAYAELNNALSSGYGSTIITNFNGIENSDLAGGSNTNFVAYIAARFTVTGNGQIRFRFGSDFGRGGELRVDGQTLEAQWSDDLWWNGSWSNGGDVLQGSINLSAGEHYLEILGSEGGNDGGMALQVCTANNCGTNSSNWRYFSTANFSSIRAIPPSNDSTLTIEYRQGYDFALTATLPARWTDSVGAPAEIVLNAANAGSGAITGTTHIIVSSNEPTLTYVFRSGNGWTCPVSWTGSGDCTYSGSAVASGSSFPPLYIDAYVNSASLPAQAAYDFYVVNYPLESSETRVSNNRVSGTLPVVHVLEASGTDCSAPGGGLWAKYYTVPNNSGFANNRAGFQSLIDTYASGTPTRQEVLSDINYYYGGTDLTYFLSVIEGYIYVPVSGSYAFSPDGDDDVEFWIDDTYVAGIYGNHGAAEGAGYAQGSVYLEAGYHRIEFRHLQQQYQFSWYLYWNNGSGWQLVPPNSVRQCYMVYNLTLTSSVQVESDPVNGTDSPKAIPGATAAITVIAANEGDLQPDADSISILQAIPDDGDFYYNAGNGITVTDGSGALASGLTLSTVQYLDASQQVISPSADAKGYDASVRYFRLNFNGQMNSPTGSSYPQIDYEFRIRLK